MLKIVDKHIQITRGNMLPIHVFADDVVVGNDYEFQAGDILRFKIFDPKDPNKVYLTKDFKIESACTETDIMMTADEMKIGPMYDKKQKIYEYWWEIELNPDTPNTQTIVGFDLDEQGKEDPAVITILPEGGDNQGGDEE